ncbi:MAG: cell envelope biogenesis protein OmpA [Streptomycetaceae bacterium]|nr:cell envelope biogenesis protein OmpA [Streptomycetaceae bacterium]
MRCAARPQVGGLVVPWISYEHGGRAAFGSLDPIRRAKAFLHRLCQVCGERLEERICLVVRPMDVREGVAPEPGLHPECLAYSKKQCPMLNGGAATYRRTPVSAKHPAGRPCDDPACPCPKITSDDAHHLRAGRPADDFDAWMIAAAHYRLKTDPANPNHLLGIDLNVPVLRVRPIRKNPRPDAEELLATLRALGL